MKRIIFRCPKCGAEEIEEKPGEGSQLVNVECEKHYYPESVEHTRNAGADTRVLAADVE